MSETPVPTPRRFGGKAKILIGVVVAASAVALARSVKAKHEEDEAVNS